MVFTLVPFRDIRVDPFERRHMAERFHDRNVALPM